MRSQCMSYAGSARNIRLQRGLVRVVYLEHLMCARRVRTPGARYLDNERLGRLRGECALICGIYAGQVAQQWRCGR